MPTRRCFTALLLALSVAATLGATQHPFSGYSYSIAPSGIYPDTGGGELTDGIANGPAWPAPVVLADVDYLVGWQTTLPTITFTFASAVTINSVSAFFADSDTGAGVSLPATVTIGDAASFSQVFAVTNPAGSGTTVESVFNGFSITTQTLTLSFTLGTAQQWTMLSEVQAFGTAAVPEPASSGLALGAAALGLVATRRRRKGI